MTARPLALALAGATALAFPHIASAQPETERYAQPYDRDQPGYAPYSGGYYSREEDEAYDPSRGFVGYPEFRRIESRIHNEIQEGVRQDLLEPDAAHDLMSDLRQIRRRETEQFREHGWQLPPDERDDIRSDLAELDQRVIEKRAEP